MSILLLESLHADAEALLGTYGTTLLVGEEASEPFEPGTVEAILTRGRGRITDALMARCPQLRVIARCGVGLDNIDTQAANQRGIAVIYAPGATTATVAEHTLMLMLAAARQLRLVAQAVHTGNWNIRNGYRGLELAGKTLGIIGLGQIGRRVRELATAFGMHVVTWSRSAPAMAEQQSLEQLLRDSDVISIHVALTPETHHLIGAHELALMKPGAILINTARGAIIDQAALRVAIAKGQLGGFAADVLEQEPPRANETLLHDDRVLVTPHIAVLTDVTYRAICVETATNVLAILRGEEPNPISVFRG
ncbi:MAG: hydroxyacid dehydrogenase [Roseiflexaceae bacterium]|nr:hydroxyacid dehydrogenase [Roseiflexaceae bacterium]